MSIFNQIKKLSFAKFLMILGGSLLTLFLVTSVFFMKQVRKNEQMSFGYAVEQVKKGSLASSKLLSGKVKTIFQDSVQYDASKGYVTAISVYEGQAVGVGDPLLSYETREEELDIELARNAVAKAQRELDYFLVTGGQVSDSATELAEEYSGVTYQKTLQDLQGNLADASTNLKKAELAYNRKFIISDIAGIVTEVNPVIDGGQSNHTLIKIAGESVQVSGLLSELDLPNVHVGQQVKVHSRAYPDKEWSGTITRISENPVQVATPAEGQSENATMSQYQFQVILAGDTADLKDGFNLSLTIVDESDTLTVPIEAVVTEGERQLVWVYNKGDQKVSQREVTLGEADGKRQEILSGLEETDFVVLSPNDLKEGQVIETFDAALLEGQPEAITESSSKE